MRYGVDIGEIVPCADLMLSVLAGADKKAEAGAGAATEFQFVSNTPFTGVYIVDIHIHTCIVKLNVFYRMGVCVLLKGS